MFIGQCSGPSYATPRDPYACKCSELAILLTLKVKLDVGLQGLDR